MSILLQALIALPVSLDSVSVDFRQEVLPILQSRCVECHQDPAKNSGKRPKGGLRLDGKYWILEGNKSGPIIVPGSPLESPLINLIGLEADDPDRMPPKGDKLSNNEVNTLRRWVTEGAHFGDWTGAPGPNEVNVPTPKPPTGKLPTIIQRLLKLGEGVTPITESARILAAGARGTISPVFPSSPLLSVSFTSHQGRTGARDLLSLAPIAENIATLDLGRTRITNASLAVTAKMSRLMKLDLRQTNISSEAIQYLTGASKLRSLNLFSSEVDDSALSIIASLKQLETVYLWQSKCTAAGVQKLRAERPDMRVIYEAILPPPERPAPDDSGGQRRRR
jgi:hypothetical protein